MLLLCMGSKQDRYSDGVWSSNVMAFSYISGHEGISSNGADDDAARKVTLQGTVMPSVQNF
jgi:enamine deaminase RidA (YjgF/YER057c/UK114 family)